MDQRNVDNSLFNRVRSRYRITRKEEFGDTQKSMIFNHIMSYVDSDSPPKEVIFRADDWINGVNPQRNIAFRDMESNEHFNRLVIDWALMNGFRAKKRKYGDGGGETVVVVHGWDD